MAFAKLKCRVCGNMYEACKSAKRKGTNAFAWQEVACSPGCGVVYFKQIAESRAAPSVSVHNDKTHRGRRKRDDAQPAQILPDPVAEPAVSPEEDEKPSWEVGSE
jgi:hypothetical protein